MTAGSLHNSDHLAKKPWLSTLSSVAWVLSACEHACGLARCLKGCDCSCPWTSHWPWDVQPCWNFASSERWQKHGNVIFARNYLMWLNVPATCCKWWTRKLWECQCYVTNVKFRSDKIGRNETVYFLDMCSKPDKGLPRDWQSGKLKILIHWDKYETYYLT